MRDPFDSFKQSGRFPFLFGTQYYRAPTPEPACWEEDLQHMQNLGFNAVKFWVQWRWTHRAPDRFYFDDLDRLMDLAAEHQLGVTLNVIFDVAPLWLYERYPDAKQIDIQGRSVEPYVVSHRQIGGHPGPCYNHPGALAERQVFLRQTLDHFRGHPAMQMWDIWNEPELCFPARNPSLETLVCYCPHCAAAFSSWLKQKYTTLEHLNEVWGRCYEHWTQVELPRGVGGVTDFIDWREFHLDTMAAEAKWRLDTTAELDPTHGRYLHIVPNNWFSAVTCADDFAMAEHCECFGGTMIGARPSSAQHVLSAGGGRVSYNAECHINFGSASLHQQEVSLKKLCAEFLPQIGLGIKGFLFWQFRSEVLGLEAPAWGLVNLDGSARAVTRAARDFWSRIHPHTDRLRAARPAPAHVGILRSRQNELYHFCMRGEVNSFNQALDAWQDALYLRSVPYRLLSADLLERGALDDLQLLILPTPYYLTQSAADALKDWVQNGGVLISEAHLMGYDGSRGRHSRVLPGGGLAQTFGLRESFSSAARHVSGLSETPEALEALPPDVRKALKESGGQTSDFFALSLANGQVTLGAQRYAEISGDDLEALGTIDGRGACMVRKIVGNGAVYYAGTNLSEAAARDTAGLDFLLEQALTAARIESTCEVLACDGEVHCDILSVSESPSFLVLINRGSQAASVRLPISGAWHGLFSGHRFDLTDGAAIQLPPNHTDLYLLQA
ncbi:MAG: beta-galactosidase [Anaerolineaceae bacterium]|nr:beta-galactosidase [Anaerolineaceae bacterium]